MNKKLSNLLKWFTEPIDEGKIARSRNNFNPVIELERELAQQIYTALQGSVVEEVLRKTKITSHDTYWRSIMEGHSLKVEKELLQPALEAGAIQCVAFLLDWKNKLATTETELL